MNKHLIHAPVNPMMELASIERRIALESDFINDFSTTVGATISGMVGSAQRFLMDLFSSKEGAKGFLDTKNVPAGKYANFVQRVEQEKFVELMSLGYFVPEGFRGNIADYATELYDSANHVAGIAANVLIPFNSFLSGIASNPETIKQTRSIVPQLAKSEMILGNLNKEIDPYFRRGGVTSKTTVGQAFGRTQDFGRAALAIYKLNEKLGEVKPGSVRELVDNTVELLNVLRDAANKGSINGISPETMKNLSRSLMIVAREVEFYSITNYRAFALVNTFEESIEKLQSILDK